MTLYPLLLEPIYKEKIWGGRSLEAFGRSLPGGADVRIGESWEVADLEATSPSGGGGEGAHSIITNGPLAGRSIADLMASEREALLGPVTAVDGRFPLLVKYLDARQNLSVQVHPSSRHAASHPDAYLKSEAWYVVAAEPGARIFRGLLAGTGRSEVERAIRDGSLPELLVRVDAVPGSCHYLPSGTCHALGAGIVVAEVQTPSDTTYRLYDWGRSDRPLHVEDGLASMSYGPVDAAAYEPGTRRNEPGLTIRAMVRCPHFAMDEWRFHAEAMRDCELVGPEVWMVVRGALTFGPTRGDGGPVRVVGGATVLLPALPGEVTVRSEGPGLALRVTIPS